MPAPAAVAEQGETGEDAVDGLNESLMRFCEDIAVARLQLADAFAGQLRLRRMPNV